MPFLHIALRLCQTSLCSKYYVNVWIAVLSTYLSSHWKMRQICSMNKIANCFENTWSTSFHESKIFYLTQFYQLLLSLPKQSKKNRAWVTDVYFLQLLSICFNKYSLLTHSQWKMLYSFWLFASGFFPLLPSFIRWLRSE